MKVVLWNFMHSEGSLDCKAYSLWQHRSLEWESKFWFIVGIWKSGYEGQQSNKQKQQFSDFPPSCASSLQVSKPQLSPSASHFTDLWKMCKTRLQVRINSAPQAPPVCAVCWVSFGRVLTRWCRPELITALVKLLLWGAIGLRQSPNLVSPDINVSEPWESCKRLCPYWYLQKCNLCDSLKKWSYCKHKEINLFFTFAEGGVTCRREIPGETSWWWRQQNLHGVGGLWDFHHWRI